MANAASPWGKVAPAKNVSLLSVMSEQLASDIETSPCDYSSGGRKVGTRRRARITPDNVYRNEARPHIMEELKGMGFSPERITIAALATGNIKTDAALEWLLNNPQPSHSEDLKEESSNTTSTEDNLADEATDRALALQLAASERQELSLEEARQLRRGFSKLTTSRDPNLDQLLSQQQRVIEKDLVESSDLYDDDGPVDYSNLSLSDQVEGMVTKHDKEECGARNADRVMNMDFSDDYNQAGDMSAIRLNNRVYNSFRRQVKHLKTRADRKSMGGRRTRASFAKAVSGDASAAIAERNSEVGPNLAPGAPCMAFASADHLWHTATVTGLATSLPRRYKVRFDESGVEEFVTVAQIREIKSEEKAHLSKPGIPSPSESPSFQPTIANVPAPALSLTTEAEDPVTPNTYMS
mmetsp:Transcript_25921/g.62444  ORF Transcript_25921/g.62444 Transcript_25921/m.62444 type:complete len:410 (-) Transcript_25921:220-1449(-)|eukprot:CAMPEP_0114496754 /NCGR_PEP_ID=MMETSP0109-20121206/5940_1 /TAXON_ID=29199 /ORGANISM="Chlorarachnion reptans, Strain CCCM449" /LENGTH=409 /DNA_ID=CAMNT_0001674051 /DNA_START=194 /DNA_END=1423 /DNA_ORIENTATION=+